MAIVYDMRTLNVPGIVARSNVSLVDAHINLSTSALAALTSKAPDAFLIDLLRRSTSLQGPIWCVLCGNTHLTNQRDWQMYLQLTHPIDIAWLQAAHSIRWLDALTLINQWKISSTGSLYFDLGVQSLAPGAGAATVENSSILV